MATESPAQEGTFRAVVTRDAEAHVRDGERYHECQYVDHDARDDTKIYEVRFADGEWMLATAQDLDIGHEREASIELD